MPINLSVKNVPDGLADRLRARAERNRRSLQRELSSILEAAVDERAPTAELRPLPPRTLTIEEVAERARCCHSPNATGSRHTPPICGLPSGWKRPWRLSTSRWRARRGIT